MFDTNIVVIGNVLTPPEWRRTAGSNTLVANFRVASTARRLDRETGRWVDGNHLRVRVNCWRRLAEGVASSVAVGDPVVVAGRLYTRDWTDSEGNLRTTYEMEAVSVGHDLSRGRARFFRTRAAATTAVEDPESLDKVRGEPASPIPENDAPTVYGEGVPDGDEPVFEEAPSPSPAGAEQVQPLRGGGFEPFDTSAMPAPPKAGEEGQQLEMLPVPTAAEPLPSVGIQPRPESPADGESRGGEAQSAEGGSQPAEAEPATPAPRRPRPRSPRRQPVAV